MRKIIFVCLLILLAFFSTAIAQNEQPQWEYLVVYEFENTKFNELGKKGWELVGIVPAVVTNESIQQQIHFIFKRPHSAERIRLEAEQKAKTEIQKAEAEFIDLDRTDAQSVQKEKERKANEKIEQAIRKIKGFSVVSIKPVSWFPSNQDRRVGAEVVIDGSKELLKDGNRYRSSEVKQFIRQVANEIYKAAELKPLYANQEHFSEYYNPNNPGVNIKLSVIVNHNGAVKTLAEGAVLGGWEPSQYP